MRQTVCTASDNSFTTFQTAIWSRLCTLQLLYHIPNCHMKYVMHPRTAVPHSTLPHEVCTAPQNIAHCTALHTDVPHCTLPHEVYTAPTTAVPPSTLLHEVWTAPQNIAHCCTSHRCTTMQTATWSIYCTLQLLYLTTHCCMKYELHPKTAVPHSTLPHKHNKVHLRKDCTPEALHQTAACTMFGGVGARTQESAASLNTLT